MSRLYREVLTTGSGQYEILYTDSSQRLLRLLPTTISAFLNERYRAYFGSQPAQSFATVQEFQAALLDGVPSLSEDLAAQLVSQRLATPNAQATQ